MNAIVTSSTIVKENNKINTASIKHLTQNLLQQSEISKMPSLYLLGRTATLLNYLISFKYNCYILIIRYLPDCQSNFIICYIRLGVRSYVLSYVTIFYLLQVAALRGSIFNSTIKLLGVIDLNVLSA